MSWLLSHALVINHTGHSRRHTVKGGGGAVAGVIGARCASLATRVGGENLERFEIGLWFG